MNRFLVAALLGMTLAAPVSAHPLAPALLQLTETAPARYEILWRTPVARMQGRDVNPQLPAECKALDAPQVRIEDGEALVSRWSVQCAGGLANKSIAVDGIEASGINVVVRVALLQGEKIKGLLGADQPALVISLEQESVLARYFALGGEHLITGVDHLLFLLGLFVLSTSLRRLVVTVTAFTVGHSLTLALAVLDVVHIRQQYAEIAIALTILALALELSRAWPASTTLAQRKPWLMAGAFGLVHGLGFAGALRDVGLPADDVPQALFAFNAGIEAAQLGLIALLTAAVALSRRMPLAWRTSPALARAVPAYLMGSLAACWCFERFALVLG